MSVLSAIDVNNSVKNVGANYNAVKIKVNEPKVFIPESTNRRVNDNNSYNGVSIEIDRPVVESSSCSKPEHKCCYDYPCATCAVNSQFAPIHPISVPKLPVYSVAYQATAFIDTDKKNVENAVEESVVVDVPVPNVVSVEEQIEKPEELSFQGLNFKAEQVKQPIEIVPPVDIKPDVDIPTVVANLSNSNFDVQAKQMEEIAKASMEDVQKVVPYIVTEVFAELINILEKDSSDLNPPSERQIELRKKIIINEIVKERARENNTNVEDLELPYNISEEELKEASNLSAMEQAERNKEYALYSIAILSKAYTDEVHRHTGNVVPLTELPGISAIVDVLKSNSNPEIKISAIDALRYIYRPEYKEELVTLMNIVAKDQNPYISNNAVVARESFN
jgi:hypothetical protein